jgi:DNA-directed RNA polymerase beta' subunit
MRNNEVGPLSKATFEESVDILISAAMRTEVENNAGVSAAVISGNQPKVGTGFMGLMIDYKKLMQSRKVSETKDEYVPEDF